MSARSPRLVGRPAGQDGSVSLFLVVAVLALFIAVGLVVDGGQKLRSTQRADDVASEAARAGVQSVQPASTVRGQPAQVNPEAAISAARHYLSVAGVAGTVTVTGRASARLARGVDQEQP